MLKPCILFLLLYRYSLSPLYVYNLIWGLIHSLWKYHHQLAEGGKKKRKILHSCLYIVLIKLLLPGNNNLLHSQKIWWLLIIYSWYGAKPFKRLLHFFFEGKTAASWIDRDLLSLWALYQLGVPDWSKSDYRWKLIGPLGLTNTTRQIKRAGASSKPLMIILKFSGV